MSTRNGLAALEALRPSAQTTEAIDRHSRDLILALAHSERQAQTIKDVEGVAHQLVIKLENALSALREIGRAQTLGEAKALAYVALNPRARGT